MGTDTHHRPLANPHVFFSYTIHTCPSLHISPSTYPQHPVCAPLLRLALPHPHPSRTPLAWQPSTSMHRLASLALKMQFVCFTLFASRHSPANPHLSPPHQFPSFTYLSLLFPPLPSLPLPSTLIPSVSYRTFPSLPFPPLLSPSFPLLPTPLPSPPLPSPRSSSLKGFEAASELPLLAAGQGRLPPHICLTSLCM